MASWLLLAFCCAPSSPYLTLGRSQGCVKWTRIQLSAWVPALLIRNCDILPERAWVHTGVPHAVAECHLEIVTEQIIITLKAFSFILVYARRRLTPSSSSPPPHTMLKERKKNHPLVTQPFIWHTIIGKGPNCLPHQLHIQILNLHLKECAGQDFHHYQWTGTDEFLNEKLFFWLLSVLRGEISISGVR